MLQFLALPLHSKQEMCCYLYSSFSKKIKFPRSNSNQIVVMCSFPFVRPGPQDRNWLGWEAGKFPICQRNARLSRLLDWFCFAMYRGMPVLLWTKLQSSQRNKGWWVSNQKYLANWINSFILVPHNSEFRKRFHFVFFLNLSQVLLIKMLTAMTPILQMNKEKFLPIIN